VFAVSLLLPAKIQHLAFHLITIRAGGISGLPEHVLSIMGLFVLLSVLTWIQERNQRPVRPLNAYPPHSQAVVSAHIAGLIAGTLFLFM
jgi:hypothetical protein